MLCFAVKWNNMMADKSFEQFLRSLTDNCDEEILQRFQTVTITKDVEFTTVISTVINKVSTNLGKLIVGPIGVNIAECMSLFANCVMELPDSITGAPDAHCYDDDEPPCTAQSPAECFKVQTNRDTFTFFALESLLNSKSCNDKSKECIFKSPDEQKAFIRFLKHTFFDDSNDERKEIPFVKDSQCNEKLKNIRSDSFTSADIQDQTDDITFFKTRCIDRNQIDSDYKIHIENAGHPGGLEECWKYLKQCYEGKFK